MSQPEPFAYDTVFYPGGAFEQTHPDRLATIGALFGMSPAPPSRCRVLELGCGFGANLAPMAAQFPESEFLGIDLSAPTIALGRTQAEALGLKNLDLRACDIMDVGADFGMFDYIVAHGVYSWVPPHVRDKMLAIFHDNLSPHGIAYVSYNAYPASHLRDLGRCMMQYHTRGVTDPDAQVKQSRALLRFLADAADPDEVYGAALREVRDRVQRKGDEVLYHDDLNAGAAAFLLHQVVDAAAAKGLRYLSEATFALSTHGAMPEHARAFISQIPPENLVEREQYFDFLVGCWFREMLLCRADTPLRTDVDPQAVRNFHIAAKFTPATAGVDPRAEGAETFSHDQGNSLTVTRPLTKAALLHLGRVWPQAISFGALVEAATGILGENGAADAEQSTLAATLFRAYASAQLELWTEAPRLVTTLSDRPAAGRVARHQAISASRVTNLRHVNIELKDEILRDLLLVADGTRSVDDIAAALDSVRPPEPDMGSRERAELALRGLARLALLEG